MTQFPNFRQPAMGIQDAAMLPAQTAGNLLIQRLASAEAAFIPTTQTFASTTSSTTLNSTAASSGGGSLRSLMMPLNTDHFVPIVQQPSPAFYNGPLFSQFGNPEIAAAIARQGCAAGRAVLGACGIDFPGSNCGCACVRELGEEVVIDEDNTNGIDDDPDTLAARAKVAAPVATTVPVVTVPAATAPATQAAPAVAEAAAATANVQYVMYNA